MTIDDYIAEYGPERVIEALTPWVTDARQRRIDDVLNRRLITLTALFENLHDPHNGAAAVRSLEAFGLAELYAVESIEPFRTHKGVSLGGRQWLTVHRYQALAPCVSLLKSRGFAVCATLPDATQTLADLDWSKPRVFAFGNEHDGLSEEAVAACDERITIPMHGFTQSLNLSVSAALVMSRAAEYRRNALDGAGDLPEADKVRLKAKWLSVGVRAAVQLVERHVSQKTPSGCGSADTML